MDKNKQNEKIVNIEDLLKERAEIDRVLEEKFAKRMAIFFTDIAGSTAFYDAHGDIAGRALIQRHNDIAFPAVTEMGGTIIKTTGDGMLAAFDTALSAVKCAVRIQEAVSEYNRGKLSEPDRVYLKIALNYGTSLVDTNDIYGDVVNTCARFISCAEPNQIVISETVYREVKREEGVYVRYLTAERFKGKSQPVKVYQVLWRDEEFESVAAAAGMLRSFGRQRSFCLDILRDGDKLKVASYEREEGRELTLRHYEETALDGEKLNERINAIYALLNKASVEGRIEHTILEELQKTGTLLFDELLTQESKERIRATTAANLVLYIDDNLVHVPWELLYDGRAFLSRRFSMGRIVRTKQTPHTASARSFEMPLKMLIISDPRRDLEQAYKEGVEIKDLLREREDKIKTDFISSKVSVDYVKKNLKNYDIIHYAGHAEYISENPSHSAWRLADGNLRASDVVAMAGGEPLPALVFSNGCQSGKTSEWQLTDSREVYGLANSFLLAGVQHYIGTFWDVRDKHSLDFAIYFYRALLGGATVGEAIRSAREGLIKTYGEELIVWASYMLYGDPATKLFEVKQTAEEFLVAQETAQASGALRSASQEALPWYSVRGLSDKSAISLIGAALAVLIGIGIFQIFKPAPPVIIQSLQPPAALARLGVPAVPIDEPLRLTMNVIGQREDIFGDWSEVVVSESAVLRTGDQFFANFEVNQDAYVYLILYDSQKAANVLFPGPKIELQNPVKAGVSYTIPGPGYVWWLDDNTGTETLYLVATRTPLESVDKLLAEMDGLSKDERVARSTSINDDLLTLTRGVGGITKGRTKTFQLKDGKEIEKISEIVEGQADVARAISFHHR